MTRTNYWLIPGKLWDGVSDRPVAGQAVQVRNERIAAVAPIAEVPANAQRIEFPDCLLMPGLIDAHVHYSEPMGPSFLAAGVTSIRDVGNDLTWVLRQRDLLAKNPLSGPTMTCCGFLLNGTDGIWIRMGRAHKTEEEIRKSVREEVAAGVDQIKFYAYLSLPLLTAGIDEAHKQGKIALSHLPTNIDAVDAIRAGLDQIEHQTSCKPGWEESTDTEKDALIDLMLEHRTVLDPTLVVWDRIGRIYDRSFQYDERRARIHPHLLNLWDRLSHVYLREPTRLYYQTVMPRLKKFLSRAVARGVTVGLGTDTPWPHIFPGFSVHDELAMYVDADIAPVTALRCATSTNARIIGRGDEVGRIAPGLIADLTIVNGDPTKDIRDIGRIAGVVHRGINLDLKKLEEAVQQAKKLTPTDASLKDIEAYIVDSEQKILKERK